MRATRILAIAPLGLVLPLPAFAHHAMDSAAPASLAEGVLSGLAHPVIGVDHLAFLVAAGLLAGTVRDPRAWIALPAFLLAGLLGALLHLAGIGLGPVEAVVALSALAAGAVLLLPGAAPARPAWLGVAFALAGLFHGHALTGAVEGSPLGVTIAYLGTLALAQGAIGLAAAAAGRHLGRAPLRRLAGAGAAAVGVAAFVAALTA